MTAIRSRSGSTKIIATVGMILMMAFFSACDVLATEGARDAIANGREIRAFEDENLVPLQNELNDIYIQEIQPRETQIEDLRHELQILEEDLLQPLWAAQNDIWSPGGAASELQEEFELRYREIELAFKAIEVDQRELDSRWQTLWNNTGIDPEYQALEDQRYESQRELDRLYRFGNRPIDDIWSQINDLNSSAGWANTDRQIEAEQINIELRRLWDIQTELQNSGNEESNDLYTRASHAQDELNNLYNFGWEPIYQIQAEIEQLEHERNSAGASATTSSSGTSIEVIDLQNLIASYEINRDAAVADLNSQISALQADTTSTSTTSTADPTGRIAELESLIAGLEAEAAALVAAKEAEKDDLANQINEKKDSYDQLISDAEDSFTTLSASLLADAETVAVDIAALEAIGGDDIQAELAEKQSQYDGLIAAEQSEEDELHALVAQYELERDTGVDELQVLKDAVEAELLAGVTDSIDAQLADYREQLAAAKADVVTTTTTDGTGTTETTDNSQAIADLQAQIVAVQNEWNLLIAEVTNKIQILQNEAGTTTTSVDSGLDTRIESLRLQMAELERSLQAEITKLETLVSELYRQAESIQSGSSGQHQEIQRQIDVLNTKLTDIWAQESANGLDILIQVQELEKQARALGDELKEQQYALEEIIWDLDDQLNRFYKNQGSDQQTKEAVFQEEANVLQLRRAELEEMRWAIDDEQRSAFDAIEDEQRAAGEAIKLIEDEQLGAIKEQVRALELEIRSFYGQQQEIENAIREAQALVEEKKRELEDKVFDALESAAGTVDEAGDTVLTATEESGADDTIEEPTPEATGSEVTPTGAAN
jgi:hypothetical protein